MPLQILTLKLDGITAGDYLTWCRDPEPPALDYMLRSISIDADPLGDTITAILDWNEPPPTALGAASAAGLPASTGVTVDATLTDKSPLATGTGPHLTRAAATLARGADVDAERRLPRKAGAEGQLRTAA
jgi:hypothetical protein